MEVILREDFISLGYVGDSVRVKRGFARNYLIPRGIAVESSSANDRVLKHKLAAIIAKRVKKKAEADQFGKILEQVTVEFTLKMGATGKSFGSVTTKDIESSLKALGYEVDRRQIRLIEAIRAPGVHKVEVKLHSEVVVPVQVKVIAAQIVAPVAADTDESGKKRKSRKRTDAAEEGAEEAVAEGAEQEAAATDAESTEQ